MDRRQFFLAVMTGIGGVGAFGCATTRTKRIRDVPRQLIGYTEYRTNLPGGRHANAVTMRACVVRADGAGRRLLVESLVNEPCSWTQFAGWSPDGRSAIIGSGWESPENGAWEEEHRTFRFTEGWRYDMHLLDLVRGDLSNLTAVERVSDYNTGLFFVPNSSPPRLGFQALIGGVSHPFTMDLDGRNKKDVASGQGGFAYGFSASPDGQRIAYHENYQIFTARADGSDARRIDTGKPFNFCPQWSPDSQWLMFVAGEHYNCHPYVAKSDGTGLRQVGDRKGYKGVVDVFDVPDFHSGSSDVPVWSPDGAWIYYTAKFGDGTQLVRVSLDGNRTEQLTRTFPPTLTYHPKLSPDGHWVAFGANPGGVRQIYVMPAGGGESWPITRMQPGSGAMWPSWQPEIIGG